MTKLGKKAATLTERCRLKKGTGVNANRGESKSRDAVCDEPKERLFVSRFGQARSLCKLWVTVPHVRGFSGFLVDSLFIFVNKRCDPGYMWFVGLLQFIR